MSLWTKSYDVTIQKLSACTYTWYTCFSKFYKMKFVNLVEICLWLHLVVKGLKQAMTFTQYAEKKCTSVLRGRNCRFWSHLAVFRTESQYFFSNMYRSRLCIKRFFIYKKKTPSYCVKASLAGVFT